MKSSIQTSATYIPSILIFMGLIGLSSCGSYYNVSQEDGIYNSRDYSVYQVERSTPKNKEEEVDNQDDNFFAKKLATYENIDENEVLTDIDSYRYDDNKRSAAWGSSNTVTIAVVDPFYYRNAWNSYFYADYYYGYYPPHYYYNSHFYNPYYYSYYNPYYYTPYYRSGFYLGYYWGYGSHYHNHYYSPIYRTKYYDSYGKRDSYNTSKHLQRSETNRERFQVSPYSGNRRPTIGTSTRRSSDEIRSDKSRINTNPNYRNDNQNNRSNQINNNRRSNDGGNESYRRSNDSNSRDRGSSSSGKRRDNVSYNNYENNYQYNTEPRNNNNVETSTTEVGSYRRSNVNTDANFNHTKKEGNNPTRTSNVNRNQSGENSNKRASYNTNNNQRAHTTEQNQQQREVREVREVRETRNESSNYQSNPSRIQSTSENQSNNTGSVGRRRD